LPPRLSIVFAPRASPEEPSPALACSFLRPRVRATVLVHLRHWPLTFDADTLIRFYIQGKRCWGRGDNDSSLRFWTKPTRLRILACHCNYSMKHRNSRAMQHRFKSHCIGFQLKRGIYDVNVYHTIGKADFLPFRPNEKKSRLIRSTTEMDGPNREQPRQLLGHRQ
jgi:hypothetical protein